MINSQKLIETIGSDSADSPSASTSDWSFFSYPPEVRNKIYAYLAPLRIHICPPEYVQLTRYMEPWALVAVSSQFRTEIRAIIYPPTPIDLYPLGAVGKPFDEPEYDEFNETMGEWELRWQQHVEGEWTNCQDVVSDALLDMGLQTAEPTTAALTGFGKNGIRTLVEAFVTTYRPKDLSQFRHEDFDAIELGLQRYQRLLEEEN
ncbi:MAG: hypothetical protein Q9176_006203 [Flavoplaca citrina]